MTSPFPRRCASRCGRRDRARRACRHPVTQGSRRKRARRRDWRRPSGRPRPVAQRREAHPVTPLVKDRRRIVGRAVVDDDDLRRLGCAASEASVSRSLGASLRVRTTTLTDISPPESGAGRATAARPTRPTSRRDAECSPPSRERSGRPRFRPRCGRIQGAEDRAGADLLPFAHVEARQPPVLAEDDAEVRHGRAVVRLPSAKVDAEVHQRRSRRHALPGGHVDGSDNARNEVGKELGQADGCRPSIVSRFRRSADAETLPRVAAQP